MSTEHAYAYEAGYRDGSIHYELEHCPACKNVADLQESLAENAKLRELAKRMARALGVGSNLCDRNCGWEFECDMVSCPIEKAMRELGIEVDE